MMARCFALFDTAIGRSALAWSDRGIAGLQLAEDDERATRARMIERFPSVREAEPTPDIRRAVDAISALLRGEASDLSFITLDMDAVPPFDARVYEVARTIPPGATLSYGDIARRIGDPGAARAVGRALARNPFVIVVPCHRVVASGGKPGGFSAPGGRATKLRMLAIEGAQLF